MSAYMIDDSDYIKFLDVLLQLSTNNMQHEILHSISYFHSLHGSGPRWHDTLLYSDERKAIVVNFVCDMVQLNADSVRYRYPNDKTDEVHKAMAPANEVIVCKRKLRSHKNRSKAFSAYGKPKDYLELAGFLRCWNYQSCEIPDSVMDKKQQDLMTAVKTLRADLLEKGLEKATGGKASWGHLEFTFETSEQPQGPKVVDIMDLAKGG